MKLSEAEVNCASYRCRLCAFTAVGACGTQAPEITTWPHSTDRSKLVVGATHPFKFCIVTNSNGTFMEFQAPDLLL